MLAIISHNKNFDSQIAFQMIFENGAKAIIEWYFWSSFIVIVNSGTALSDQLVKGKVYYDMMHNVFFKKAFSQQLYVSKHSF